MSERAFRWTLLLIAGCVLVSDTTFPGLLLGLFFAFTVAFFVGPIAIVLQHVLEGIGLHLSWQALVVACCSLYTAAVFVLAFRAWALWRGPRRADARLVTVQACLLAALPLIAYLSSHALVRAWH